MISQSSLEKNRTMQLEIPAGAFRAYISTATAPSVDSMPLSLPAPGRPHSPSGTAISLRISFHSGRQARPQHHRRPEPDARPQHAHRLPRPPQGSPSTSRSFPASKSSLRWWNTSTRSMAASLRRRLRQPPRFGHRIAHRCRPARQIRRLRLMRDYKNPKPAPDCFLLAAKKLASHQRLPRL